MDQFMVESIVATLERTIKRLWLLCIVAIILLVGTNIAWIYYESQFETVYTDETHNVDQDIDTGDGDANITGIGDIYGENTSAREAHGDN